MKERSRGDGGYLDYIPIAGGIKKQIDHGVKEMGFQQTAAKLIEVHGGIKLIIRGKDAQVKGILEKDPAVVIANHPSFAEIATVIASLEPREDIYLIGIANFLGIGPNFSKHVIPIYMTRQMSSEEHKFLVRLGNILHLGPRIPPNDAHEKNVESMDRAVETVKNGGLVVMFPEGVQSARQRKWLNGIGHLLKEIGGQSNSHLIFVHSDGTTGWDYLRWAPGIKKLLPRVITTFAKPRTIGDALSESTDPIKITKKLEEAYNNWISTIAKSQP